MYGNTHTVTEMEPASFTYEIDFDKDSLIHYADTSEKIPYDEWEPTDEDQRIAKMMKDSFEKMIKGEGTPVQMTPEELEEFYKDAADRPALDSDATVNSTDSEEHV